MIADSIFSVECPSCHASHPVDGQRVPHEGLHVLCSRCWRVFPLARPGLALPEADEAWRAWAPPSLPGEPVDAVSPPSTATPAVSEPEVAPPDVMKTEVAQPDLMPVEVAQPEVAQPEGLDFPESPRPREPGGSGASLPEVPDPVATPVNPFARRDPHDRARRLARVLASDIVSYYGDRYARALEAGTLLEEFREEVQKSWEEYIAQVGEELGESTPYFREALNEVLARGQQLF